MKNVEDMETKEYPLVICKRDKGNGIIFSEYHQKMKVDITIAKEIVANRLEFTQNKPHYVVIDISNIKGVTPEAKAYMQSPEGGLKNILGAAFVAHDSISELMAKIYVKTPKDFEAMCFNNKEDAVAWLQDQIKNNSNTSSVIE